MINEVSFNIIDIFGYIALIINLSSMAIKNVLNLRLLSLVSNFVYMIYGFCLAALPIIVGCAIAIGIHAFHIRILLKKKSDT